MKKKFIPNILGTIKRFPITVLFCLLSTALWSYLYKTKGFSSHQPLFFSLLVGMFIFVPLKQFSEKSSKKIMGIILPTLGLIFVIAFYFSVKSFGETVSLYRMFLFIIASVSLIPAIFPKENKELWDNLIVLFKNFVITMFFSNVMFLGVILAITTANYLFDLKLKDNIYFYTFYFFAGTYAPLLFLSNFHKKNSNISVYAESKALKIIIKFIITPLSLLYLLILYLYSAKIIILWNLPKGQVSYMVISFSVLAILTHLITYPYREKGIFKFIHKYLYYFILPLLFLLAVAIGIRIKSYGITENRYYIVIFGLWILFLSLFGIFTKFKKLKVIFVSLSIVSIMTIFGFWSSFSISKRSQINRFAAELKKYHILSDDNKLLPYDKKTENLKDVKSILDYLNKMNYLKDFTKNIVSDKKIDYKYFYDEYKLNKISRYRYNGKYFSIKLEKENPLSLDITDYDYFIDLDSPYTTNFANKEFIFDNKTTKIKNKDGNLIVFHNSEKINTIPFKEITKNILKKNEGNYINLTTDYEYRYKNPNSDILFVIKQIGGNKNKNSEDFEISYIKFLLFYNYHKKSVK